MSLLLKILSAFVLGPSTLAIALGLVLQCSNGSHAQSDLLPTGWGLSGIAFSGALWLWADLSEARRNNMVARWSNLS